MRTDTECASHLVLTIKDGVYHVSFLELLKTDDLKKNRISINRSKIGTFETERPVF